MPRRPVPFLIASVLLAAAAPAAAQPSAQPVPILLPPPPPSPPVERSLGDRTHNSIFPNGKLLADGEVQFQMHELGIYNRAAFGVHDRIELSIGAPLIPVVVTAGARLSLTQPDARLRMVVGASVWSPLNDDDDGERAYQGTITAGHQWDRFEIHASAAYLKVPGGGDEDFVAWSAGFAWHTGARVALIAELGRFTEARATGDCGDCGAGWDRHGYDGLLAGVKLMGERLDTDFGLLIVGDREERETITLPVISMAYRY